MPILICVGYVIWLLIDVYSWKLVLTWLSFHFSRLTKSLEILTHLDLMILQIVLFVKLFPSTKILTKIWLSMTRPIPDTNRKLDKYQENIYNSEFLIRSDNKIVPHHVQLIVIKKICSTNTRTFLTYSNVFYIFN